MTARSGIRVGVDVASIRQVGESLEHFGDRYLRRLFSDHELSSCATKSTISVASLAARFAAKEALIKVLRPSDRQPPWRSIEVRRRPGGWCSLELSGYAQDLAEQAGITELSTSLSHEGDMAVAVVVATVGDELHESLRAPTTAKGRITI